MEGSSTLVVARTIFDVAAIIEQGGDAGTVSELLGYRQE
jgi:hypothetical protein